MEKITMRVTVRSKNLEDHVGYLGENEVRVILKWGLKNQNLKMWALLKWLRDKVPWQGVINTALNIHRNVEFLDHLTDGQLLKYSSPRRH
jgi:hypothetical protein